MLSVERPAVVNAKIAFVITIIFVAFQIQMSIRDGTLGLPPTYDDVGYFVDAANRVGEFLRGGLAEMTKGYFSSPPHAPGSTLLAALGFLLFGMAPISAALANSIPLFFLTLAILQLCDRLPLGVAVITVTSLLLIPIFGLAIVEFRPDMWSAIFTVVGTLFIIFGNTYPYRNWAILAGIAFATALLMKPTFSPMVVMLFGTAIVLRWIPLTRQSENWMQAAKSVGLIVGIPLILAGLHYMLALPELVEYYRWHVFGAASSVWQPNLTVLSQLLYYVSGPGGRPTIGLWLLPCAATLAIPFWLWRYRRWSALRAAISLVFLGSLAYVIVTIPGMKSPFVGMVFPAYLVSGVVISVVFVLRELCTRGAQRMAVTFSVVLLLFAVGTYRSPWIALHGSGVPLGFAADRFEVLDRVTHALSQQPGLGQEKVLFTQIAQYLNPDTLTFRLQQANEPVPEFLSNYLSDDIKSYAQFFERATYVVAMTPANSLVLSWLPGAKIADKVFEQIVPSGFELISEIPESGGTGQVQIYRRVK